MTRVLATTPVHPLFGAEVDGLDLRQPMSPDLVEAVDKAMDRYAVLVFRGQDLSDEQQMAFAKHFGAIELTRSNVDVDKQRLTKGMGDVSNLGVDGSILARDARRRMFNLGNQLWHSDSSFKPVPAKYSMLHARSIPPVGGETEFADMRAAWDALPEAMQHRIENLICEHSLLFSRAMLGFAEFTEAEREMFAPVRQRLVRKHPSTGKRSLFLSSHIGRIDGWPTPEAMALIRDLTEHATQREFVHRHEWQVNDLVVWDNRCTMHRGRSFDDQRYPRDMRRVTLEGSVSTLEEAA
jgi:alpha-ketoglutarate-dependent 2,4-dichlorophenoxyacetate dioxygenase